MKLLNKPSFLVFALTTLALLFARSVFAHPHSWIDTKTEIMGNHGTIDGLKMEWTFDRMTTAYLLDGEDMSAQHKQQTLSAISKSIIHNMLASHNFTYLDEGKRSLDYQKVVGETLRIEQGKAILDFTLPLVKPYRFHGAALSLRIFDPTYYVDMSWTSVKDIQFSQGLKSSCTSSLIEPHPTASQVNKAMTLPVDAGPDYQLGKVFTQTLRLSCTHEDK